MVRLKISCAETWESLLPDIPFSEKFDNVTFTSANGSGCLNSKEYQQSACFGSVEERTPQSGTFLISCTSFGGIPDKIPLGIITQTSIEETHGYCLSAKRIQASSENKYENSSSGSVTHSSQENQGKLSWGRSTQYSDSEDEQNSDDELYNNQIRDPTEKENSDSTLLTLVNCSVTCAPLCSAPIHVDERSIGNPANDVCLVNSVSERVDHVSTQKMYYNCGIERSDGESVHQNRNIISANPLRSVGRYRPYKSMYRGVTRHKWTGKFEPHLWHGSCSTEGRSRRGKQVRLISGRKWLGLGQRWLDSVYLGGYETAEEAARAHDLATLKCWGPGAFAKLNFSISNYDNELEEMESMSFEELVAFL